MTGCIVDFRRGGVDRHVCYLVDTTDAESAALALARRIECRGDEVVAVSVLDGVETLADVERAAQGPVPGIAVHVLLFDEGADV